MATGSDSRRSSPDQLGDPPSFVLERFDWGAPDRLELAGTFSGIGDAPTADPVLTVQGPDGPRRLPALRDGHGAGPPADDAPWSAAFAWLEAPVAFDRARLELGATLAVDLPGPGEAEDGGALPVEHSLEDDGAGSPPEAIGAADRLRLEAQLLDAQQQLEETRVIARRAEEALERAQADLTAEREREAADAVRFREGLATVQASAEEALGAAALASSRAEQEAQSEIAALRERVAQLEPVAAEVEAMRADLDAARTALDDARSAAEDMLVRLARHADPAAEGR